MLGTDHNKKDGGAIITTDVDLSEDEVIHYYGNHWNIAQMFKACKQYLKFTRENISTSFDALMSQLVVVFVRYVMLTVYERPNSNERSLGELF